MPRETRVRRRLLLALGAAAVVLGIAIVGTRGPEHQAVAATDSYRAYTPGDPATVVAKVAPRDPHEVQLRRVLLAQPTRSDVAVQLARIDIQRYRTLSDPRYLGRATATLARWWSLAEPPLDVLFVRATIRQSLHDFKGARADLDRLLAVHPRDPNAHLLRATVATIMADYDVARQSCGAIARLATPLVAASCVSLVEAITGKSEDAYAGLQRILDESPGEPATIKTWAMTDLAEIAIMRGDYATAERHLRAVVELDPDDNYGRAALADVLMWSDKAAEASRVLAGREQIDNLLVRRAIAEHMMSGPDRDKLVQAMRDRISAAAERGDRIHLREEARFTLEVEKDAAKALRIALEDFAVQKELADARLVAAAAFAAGDLAAAEPVRSWATTNHVADKQLQHWLGAP